MNAIEKASRSHDISYCMGRTSLSAACDTVLHHFTAHGKRSEDPDARPSIESKDFYTQRVTALSFFAPSESEVKSETSGGL